MTRKEGTKKGRLPGRTCREARVVEVVKIERGRTTAPSSQRVGAVATAVAEIIVAGWCGGRLSIDE